MPNHSEGPPGASDFSHGVEKRRARQFDHVHGLWQDRRTNGGRHRHTE